MGPTALGGAAYQISIFINTQLASTLAVGSVSFLYYADRLMQFPLGVLTLALATAALPALSRMVTKGDMDNFQLTFRSTLSLQFFITIPAMTGLVVMAQPLVELLFERGEFNSFSSLQTARALWAYSLGLPFLSGASLIARAFFSLSDTKTPAKISAISLFLGLIMAVGLIFPLKHVGLALASSLTSIINFFWLLKLLKRHNFSSFKPLFKETANYCLWALIMGLLLWPLYNTNYFSEVNKLLRIIFGLFFGPFVFFGLALIFKCPHINILKQLIERFKRKILN
jgi:putative peptidoglycan lipid II flippase